MIRTDDIDRLATEYGKDIRKKLGLTENDDVTGYICQAKTILKWLDQKDYVIVPDEKIRKEWNHIVELIRSRYKSRYDISELFINLFNKGIFEN